MNKKILWILFSLFLCIFIISIFKIGIYIINNNSNNKIKNELNKSINKNTNKIDFKKLKEQNPDTVGYIKVNNTNIDYVVVKTNNNDYYLNHNFNKEYNTSGWIFTDYRNKLDGTDKNIIVYGHGLKDKSMFGSLKDTMNKDWYQDKNNREITFITEKEKYKYQIFSIYEIEVEDYYINTDFTNVNFEEFINVLKSRSIYDFKINISKEDQILTLSTCSDNDKRIVVHSKKIKVS